MFSETKLRMIDEEANKLDSAWPIIANSTGNPYASVCNGQISKTSKVNVTIGRVINA